MIGPALMGLVIASSLGGASGDTVKRRRASRNKAVTRAAQPPTVEMTLVGVRYGRPPLVKLSLDVTLRNHGAQPRWFILPNAAAIPPPPVKTGVDGAQVYALSGRGRVVVARFSGTGGFQALLLPADAEVRMRQVPVLFWGHLSERSLPVEVITARRLQINAEPVEARVGPGFLSDAKADASEEDRKRIHSRDTPGSKEVPVSVEQDQRITIQVQLNTKA